MSERDITKKYNRIVYEAKAYKFNYPPYDKYVNKVSYYDKLHRNKRLKYINKLADVYYSISTDKNGLYYGVC
jgi:hypothetical protein